jgi:1,4-dihydroxy-2-naphthoate octaprenyltransferase
VLQTSTIQLLRFHFSLFLLPVYLFSLSQLPAVNWTKAALVFVILHLLVYPSSNGYNSYMDRDETPIGGLAHPLQPTRQLFYTSVAMDMAALVLSLSITPLFTLGILLYILASRAYSYRGIRLKKYPVTGFATVFIFQGSLVFWLTFHSAHPAATTVVPLLPLLVSGFLVGALYPLTQVYQHEADKEDGVRSISMLLGKRGTFTFCLLLFGAAAVLLFLWFHKLGRDNLFYLFLLLTVPVVIFFFYWMRKVYMNESAADFRHSLLMNVIATCCTTAYFTTLIIVKH